jgi:hypothetical protein
VCRTRRKKEEEGKRKKKEKEKGRRRKKKEEEEGRTIYLSLFKKKYIYILNLNFVEFLATRNNRRGLKMPSGQEE